MILQVPTAPSGKFPALTSGLAVSPDYLLRFTLAELLAHVPDPRAPILLNIYEHYATLFATNPGSSHNHQAWPGGLADHYADLLRLSWLEYPVLEAFYGPLPFTLGSAQVALFCHDAEKVVLYGKPDDPRCARFHALSANAASKEGKEKIKWHVLGHWKKGFGLKLTPAEVNAVKYTHGEGSDYRSDRRVMAELAAFVGNLDRSSARIGHSHHRRLG